MGSRSADTEEPAAFRGALCTGRSLLTANRTVRLPNLDSASLVGAGVLSNNR